MCKDTQSSIVIKHCILHFGFKEATKIYKVIRDRKGTSTSGFFRSKHLVLRQKPTEFTYMYNHGHLGAALRHVAHDA